MIDYLFCAPDVASAITDPAIALFVSADGWRLDVVNPGLQVWADAGDVTTTDPVSGQPVVTHSFLPGFWFSISQGARNAALEASPYLVLGASRDAANAGATQAQFIVALGPGQTLERFTGMHVSPLMQGASYPFT
jgi:hypothetical protein